MTCGTSLTAILAWLGCWRTKIASTALGSLPELMRIVQKGDSLADHCICHANAAGCSGLCGGDLAAGRNVCKFRTRQRQKLGKRARRQGVDLKVYPQAPHVRGLSTNRQEVVRATRFLRHHPSGTRLRVTKLTGRKPKYFAGQPQAERTTALRLAPVTSWPADQHYSWKSGTPDKPVFKDCPINFHTVTRNNAPCPRQALDRGKVLVDEVRMRLVRRLRQQG